MTGKPAKTGAVRHDGLEIPYEIIHRSRVTRRLHLELSEGGALRVVAPRRMSRRSIRKSLQENVSRVARFLARARAQQDELPRLGYRSGEAHEFLGRSCLLTVIGTPTHRGAGIRMTDEGISVSLKDPSPERVKFKLTEWYRQQAQIHFADRLGHFAALAHWTAGTVPKMRLRLMKRTWGNCSSAGLITLNPHLIKAPPKCIDYVIAHEVCHLKEHNHGPGFYALQDRLYPDWRKARALIREHGHLYLHQ